MSPRWNGRLDGRFTFPVPWILVCNRSQNLGKSILRYTQEKPASLLTPLARLELIDTRFTHSDP